MASMVADQLNPAVAAQLKGKRVLVTNDDGIDADGLARLEALARRYCDRVLRCTSEGLVELERHALEADEAEADREVAAPGAFDAKQESAPGAKRGPSR